jgi:hypothetical protein
MLRDPLQLRRHIVVSFRKVLGLELTIFHFFENYQRLAYRVYRFTKRQVKSNLPNELVANLKNAIVNFFVIRMVDHLN